MSIRKIPGLAAAALFAAFIARAPLAAAPNADTYADFHKGPFTVKLLTVEPGEGIADSYGHTALLFQDRKSNEIIVFDYGVFQFDWLFLFRFLKGDPVYMLKATAWTKTLMRYRRENRRIYEQRIEMEQDLAVKLFRRLAVNALPQNRNYVYHHYTNNCTTIYRDLFNELFDGDFKAFIDSRPSATTYRLTTSEMIENDVPHWLAINLILNSLSDRNISRWEEMFLPGKLMNYLEEYRLAKRPHSAEISPVGIMQDRAKGRPGPAIKASAKRVIWTAAFAILLLALFVVPRAFSHGSIPVRLERASRLVWWFGGGLLGSLLALISFLTTFDVFQNNLNLLAIHPLLLLAYPVDRVLCKRGDFRARSLFHLAFLALPLAGLFIAITGISAQNNMMFLLISLAIQALIAGGIRLESRALSSSGARGPDGNRRDASKGATTRGTGPNDASARSGARKVKRARGKRGRRR